MPIWLSGLRDLIAEATPLRRVMLALLVLPPGPPRHKTDLRAILTGSFALLHNRRLLGCLLATAGSCIAFGVFLTFLPLYASL